MQRARHRPEPLRHDDARKKPRNEESLGISRSRSSGNGLHLHRLDRAPVRGPLRHGSEHDSCTRAAFEWLTPGGGIARILDLLAPAVGFEPTTN
ncbi:MAG: hypothetical protein NXH96_19760 [Alteromonadaceae bacterium]|nr:hypothetical protein [Alteromonadaceae bacterium]